MLPTTVARIAELCDGAAEGDTTRTITGFNSVEEANETELSFLSNRKGAVRAERYRAACLLVPLDHANIAHGTVIRVPEPRTAFAQVVRALYPASLPVPQIHPSAVIAMTADVASSCYIGPNVSIGERSKISAGCIIHAGSVIGNDVTLGENSIVYSNVSIYDRVQIGARVVLHSGVVIGADGFGFVFNRDHYEKFPQIGTVVIGDDVELGANTCVDRAALGATRIGSGTKLDNMVHVAHNCEIGCHVVVAAQTGFSGGVVVGDYAVIGGQVGVGDKAKIESKAVVGSGAGILTSKIVRAGEPVWGTPARPLREHLQQLASVARLPRLIEQVKELSRRLDLIQQR